MQYKYKVKGKVKSSFILRGAFFSIDNNIDFQITESELKFVQEKCELIEIINLETTTEIPKPIQNTIQNKYQTAQMVRKNELQKSIARTNKNSDIR